MKKLMRLFGLLAISVLGSACGDIVSTDHLDARIAQFESSFNNATDRKADDKDEDKADARWIRNWAWMTNSIVNDDIPEFMDRDGWADLSNDEQIWYLEEYVPRLQAWSDLVNERIELLFDHIAEIGERSRSTKSRIDKAQAQTVIYLGLHYQQNLMYSLLKVAARAYREGMDRNFPECALTTQYAHLIKHSFFDVFIALHVVQNDFNKTLFALNKLWDSGHLSRSMRSVADTTFSRATDHLGEETVSAFQLRDVKGLIPESLLYRSFLGNPVFQKASVSGTYQFIPRKTALEQVSILLDFARLEL